MNDPVQLRLPLIAQKQPYRGRSAFVFLIQTNQYLQCNVCGTYRTKMQMKECRNSRMPLWCECEAGKRNIRNWGPMNDKFINVFAPTGFVGAYLEVDENDGE